MDISIHALLAESDIERVQMYYNPHLFLSTLSLRRATDQSRLNRAVRLISIHALLAESDMEVQDVSTLDTRFLSTLSLRRATASA